MGEIAFIVTLTVLIVGVATYLIVSHRRRRGRALRRQRTIESLCNYLLPGDKLGTQRREIIDDLHSLTGGRFSDEDVLDYYLKIKGLQMVDLNTFNDVGMKEYLMEATKVRFRYRELVSFYEKYLNQPQGKGKSAV